MVNFLYQFGWAMVPRYSIKHYSGCFCKGVFWRWDENLNLWTLSKAYCPPQCGWAASNQLEVLIEQILASSPQEGILPADCLWTPTATLSWVSSLLDYSVRFGTCQASTTEWANSLDKSFYIYTLMVLFLCRTLTNTWSIHVVPNGKIHFFFMAV